MLDNRAEFRRVVDEVQEPGFTLDKIDPGYKSADLPEPKEPEVMAAEPEHEAEPVEAEQHHEEEVELVEEVQEERKSDYDEEGYRIRSDDEKEEERK